MQTYRVETTISKDGTLTINGLPFQAGDEVEVIVYTCKHEVERSRRYPLRDKPARYIRPFDSVAEDEWDALT